MRTSQSKRISRKFSVRTRLLSAILITSSVVTLILTGIQLTNDYFADLNYIEKRMKEIRVSRTETLAHAVWNLDTGLIEAGLQGMLPIQDVMYVEISDTPDESVPVGEATYKSGKYDPKSAIVFTEPLYHIIDATEETPTLKAGQKLHLGDLRVVFTKEGIYDRLENKAILILATQAIKTLLVSSLILLFIHNIITRHLARIAAYFEQFDINKADSVLEFEKKRRPNNSDERDELDVVKDAINDMGAKVREHYEVQRKYQEHLQQLNESLDHRVKEQTKELAEEKHQITMLLDNMKQSIFRVDKYGKIVAPISQHSQIVFGEDILSRNVFELVFDRSELDDVRKDALKGAMMMAYGENSLQWMLAEPNLPSKLKLKELGKTVRLSYVPLFDDNDELNQVLFVLEDVTDIEILEEQRLKKDKEIALLQSFASATERERAEYFENLALQLTIVDKLLDGPLNELSLVELYRTLHTIKGNARMFRLDDIAQTVHVFETQAAQLLKEARAGQSASDVSRVEAKQHATQLRNVCVVVADTGVKFFGSALPLSSQGEGKSERAMYHQVLKTNIESLRDIVKDLRKYDNRKQILAVEKAVDNLLNVNLRDGVERLVPMVKEISARLNKQVRLEFEGEIISLPPQIQTKISDALVQIVRNSLDHGLEAAEERAAKGKDPEGLVTVSWEALADRDLVLIVKDDGRGINTEKVLKKAWEMGLIPKDQKPSEDEIKQLIFAPSLSTADQVTDISGRGVGMDVIAGVVRQLNGSIHVSSEVGKGTQIRIILKDALLRQSVPDINSHAA